MPVFRLPETPEIQQMMYLSAYNTRSLDLRLAESPLHAYVEAARRRINQLHGPGESNWREIVDRGFGEALSQGDLSGFTRVVQLVAHLLESEGRFDAILSEIDSALELTVEHPGPTASLLALRASVLPTFGKLDDARQTAQTAAEMAAIHLSGESRLKALALVESTRLVILEPPSPTLPKLVSELTSEARELDHLFVLSWMVPYVVAHGDFAGAGPLIRRTRAMAHAQNASLRVADAAVFERWQHVTDGTALLIDGRIDRRAHIPAWRDAWLDLWVAILHRNWAAAEIACNTVTRRAQRLGPHTGDPAYADALFRAATTGECPEGLSPTPVQDLTLDNLASNLSAAYAVGVAGTADDAARWLDWVSKLRRRGISTSLEVPVSLSRVHGLLALSAGKPVLARRSFDTAASEREAGLVLEGAIAAVQASELRLKSGVSEPPGVAATNRDRLLAFGIDPVPHQYLVHRAWDAGKESSAKPLLTPRELDVLRQLEHGLTYKQVGYVTWHRLDDRPDAVAPDLREARRCQPD